MSRWMKSRISSLSRISGYQKPEKYNNVLRMDTNENLALPKQFVSRIMLEASRKTDLREYPSQQFDELRTDLSKYLDLPKECIAVGNGSDQIIDLLLSTFTAYDSTTITVKPTFTFYKDRCNLHSVKVRELKLDNNFSFDANKLLAVAKDAKICYICSPNNPTGNQFDKKTMLDLIRSFHGLVIVDEAYVEFADYSLKDHVTKCDNLIVLRTMSKSFGIAGARVGYMVANKKTSELFVNTIQYPYALSSLSLKIASIALSKLNYVRLVINQVKKERKRIYDGINSIDTATAFRSNANFVLFEVGRKYQTVYRNLIKKGILVRSIGDTGSRKGCLRVTVGTKLMNNRFLNALKVVCK
ncbi:MAG: histidinol-phosphate transaminase [Nitrososphaerales archaeon]